MRGHVDLMHCLLEVGADKDKATKAGATPLFIAAKVCHLQIVQARTSYGVVAQTMPTRTMPVGKYKGMTLSDLPDAYVEWMQCTPQFFEIRR